MADMDFKVGFICPYCGSLLKAISAREAYCAQFLNCEAALRAENLFIKYDVWELCRTN